MKPTKACGKWKTEVKLGKKVGEDATSGADMRAASWHLRVQGLDHQCAQCGAECWSVEPLRCGCCLRCWHPTCLPAQLSPPPQCAGPWHCAHCRRSLAEAGVRDITLDGLLLEYVATGWPLSKAAYLRVLRAAAWLHMDMKGR